MLVLASCKSRRLEGLPPLVHRFQRLVRSTRYVKRPPSTNRYHNHKNNSFYKQSDRDYKKFNSPGRIFVGENQDCARDCRVCE
jgi:hypothetical protein